jgi:phosphoribosylamine--glycine ligase
MVTPKADGSYNIKLLEYNVRFGDPECQTLMMRLESDLLPVLKACAQGNLGSYSDKNDLTWDQRKALCVVMAASGYPGDYEKGTAILIPKTIKTHQGTKVFHAGTKQDDAPSVDHTLWRNIGGRVLGCTALGDSFLDAQNRAYDLVAEIDWPDGFCRTDIGHRAVK